MHDAGVPTARALTCTDAPRARGAARARRPRRHQGLGSGGGKGVIVCETIEAADRAIDTMLVKRSSGVAGSEVLVEEFMGDEEVWVFAITNGEWVMPMVAAQDHKRLLAEDLGPNTGGMGAYAPVSVLRTEEVHEILNTILRPTLDALHARGAPFTGLLYAGLMLTSHGPKVVEFNCRFGDPETEAILAITPSSPPLLDLLLAAVLGGDVPDENVALRATGHAVTTVVASAGYPTRRAPVT
jgi:phosphoribosylamine--glycine ligase